MTVAVITEPKAPKQASFEVQAGDAIRRLRTALSAVIAAIPAPVPIARAVDLQRALEIRNTLAWQVFKLASAAEPVNGGGTLPGKAAMRRFFEAAASRGVSRDLLDAAALAFSQFESVIKTHAGDRSAFTSMITALGDNGSSQVDVLHRRAAFKANGHIWGVQAKTQLSCFIFRPNQEDSSQIDLLGIRGLIGLRRLRRDASWVISRMRLADDDGQVRRTINTQPIDPASSKQAVSLLTEFCSQPVPRFRTVPSAAGYTNVELDDTDVGKMSAITCLVGEVYSKAFGRYQDEHNHVQTAQSLVRTPCETLIHDVLVPEGVFDRAEPEVMVYGDHRDIDPALLSGRECDLLAMPESVAYLGRDIAALYSPDVSRYVEMVRYGLNQAGWANQRFEVYRCRVAYPTMPSSVVVQFQLPKRH